MLFRKAKAEDIDAVSRIYADIHTEEEEGRVTIGWIRGVYPERVTAEAALERGDLFVLEEEGEVWGTAIINQHQVDVYEGAGWSQEAPCERVMVLHTLIISPAWSGRGYGRSFVKFYEEYAAEHGSPYLRMDTNARNRNARALYKKLGYREADIVPCVFNGIEGVQLVLLEKKLTLITAFDSPVGKLTAASEDGIHLSGLWIEGQKYFAKSVCGQMTEAEHLPVFQTVKDWLERYFAGKKPEAAELTDVIAPPGTEFQKAVWNILCEIPCGETVTYGQIAARIAAEQGREIMSAQAVGGAVGHNPISIIIPCHRVMGTGGSLTGYAGGLDKKEWLLKHEGAIE